MTVSAPAGPPVLRSVAASTVEEVHALYSDEYGGIRTVEVPADSAPFRYRVDIARIGPVQLGQRATGVGTVIVTDRDDIYGVAIARAGRMELDQAGTRAVTSAHRAVVCNPDAGPLLTRTVPRTRLRSLVVDRRTVQAHVEALLDRPVARAPRLAAGLDIDTPAGRSLIRLVDHVWTQLWSPDSVLRSPMVTAPLGHALLTGLLTVADHSLRADLERPAPACPPRAVRRATDAVHAHPEHPYTTGDLAALAGVSVRSLQQAFQSHLGVSPMAYVRRVRLARAHADLAAGRVAGVAEAASRWGFTHLGRFAAAYREVFGVPPSATLRSP